MPYIISSGDVESGIILENDTMTILDGGTASTTTVNSAGNMYVFSGGTANQTTVNEGGEFNICSGGTVKTLTLTGDNPNAENTYETPENIVPKAGSVQADSAKFQYTFPAYSVSVLRWEK